MAYIREYPLGIILSPNKASTPGHIMGRLGQKTIQWTNQNQSELWVRGAWQSAGKPDGVRFSHNPKELFLTFNYTLFYIHNCNTTLLTIPKDSSFWLVVLSRSVSIHKENLPKLARLAWTFLASAKGEPAKSFTWKKKIPFRLRPITVLFFQLFIWQWFFIE